MENENVNNGITPPQPEVPEVKPEVKKEPPKSAPPNKELSPAEMQRRKKMLIMPLIFLIFGAAMWLIFAPSKKEEEKKNEGIGFNADLPIPGDQGIIGDKRQAYEQEAMHQREKEKVRSLQDFSAAFNEKEPGQEETERQIRLVPNPDDTYAKPSRPASPSIQASTQEYQDINKQLGEWYEQPANEMSEQSKVAVESRIQELERKLSEAEQKKAAEDEQTALLEKSYQMAAKYMPQTPQPEGATEAVPQTRPGDKIIAQPVKQVRQNVVSLLAGPVSDAEFIAAYSQPRNMGFVTAAGNEGIQEKNSIRACVYQTVTLTTGKEVQIRLLEPMRAGSILIPANTVVTGACRITGERMNVTISSIQYADNIIPVELLVYDTDGQMGIFVPSSDEINAAKEVASTLASSAGTSIMISDNAASQLTADVGKGLIQGASQYVAKKMSVVKITLKANYRLLLLPKTQ